MKTLKLLALAAFALLFSQCASTAPTAPAGPAPSLLEVLNILDTTQSTFLQYADSTKGDPWKAIARTTQWLSTQPNVASANSFDSTHIIIVMKSGVRTMFFFDQIGADSLSITRGGEHSGVSGIRETRTGTKSANTITNKRVLFYIPPGSYFYGDNNEKLQPVLDKIANSGLGLTVTVLSGRQASWQQIQNFGDYGLVIIDTHGFPDEFMTGSRVEFSQVVGAAMTEQDLKNIIEDSCGLGTYDKCTSDLLILSRGVSMNSTLALWQQGISRDRHHFEILWATSKYIETLPSMPNTVIFGNMCYSGWPIRVPFLNKNLISYYCYNHVDHGSGTVSEPFAQAMEDSLVGALIVKMDSTGRANLQPNGNEFFDNYPLSESALFFRHFGADNYSYAGCVSQFTDARDGQVYKAVCIGGQNWMAQNLNYNAPGSRVYDDQPSNGAIYGRLYDWQTLMQSAPASSASPSGVQGVCPKGWHIPSLVEFETMENVLGGDTLAGGPMKSTSSLWQSPNVGATNSSGFAALPGGWWDSGVLAYFEIGTSAQFWTTDDVTANGSGTNAWYSRLENQLTPAYINNTDKGKANSCRCVKDP